MSFIQRELDKINEAIRSDKSSFEDTTRLRAAQQAHTKIALRVRDLARLRAAQQALAWATDPEGFASPYNAIFKIEGKPVTGLPQPDGNL